jgi:hypothetical protein
MPYNRERAGKGGHADLVRNPDVTEFLENCSYMRLPSDQEGAAIASSFTLAPTGTDLPLKAIASDASRYSDAISGKFPSTQVGYVKVSLVLIDLKEFASLTEPGSRYVDPFKVAAMHRNADAISFTLPGSNIRYKNAATVKDGFRHAVFDQYSDKRTNFSKDGKYSLSDTLLAINGGNISIKKCPSCGSAPDQSFAFNDNNLIATCSSCHADIYVTDDLRLHEQVSDYGDCSSAITRFMNVTEHLLVASLIRMLATYQPAVLSNMAFILDGPLAIFGQPADVHSRLMALYSEIAAKQIANNLQAPIVIGLQKDGQVMEHARSIAPFLNDLFPKKSVFRAVDDAYRGKYISEVQNTNFGHETYYGQDFILKTESGRIFTVGIPYPYENKQPRASFADRKSDPANYGNLLSRSFDLIGYFEFDLYDNAVVPIALAHRHASISLVPGGKVLDLVTKHGLGM